MVSFVIFLQVDNVREGHEGNDWSTKVPANGWRCAFVFDSEQHSSCILHKVHEEGSQVATFKSSVCQCARRLQIILNSDLNFFVSMDVNVGRISFSLIAGIMLKDTAVGFRSCASGHRSGLSCWHGTLLPSNS